MEITIIVFLLLVIGGCGYVITNLLKKVETLEERYEENQIYMNSLSKAIGDSNLKLKELDEKGTFKGDDEIGWFFKSILYIQEILNQYNLNEKEKQKGGTSAPITPTEYNYRPYQDPTFGQEEKEAKNY